MSEPPQVGASRHPPEVTNRSMTDTRGDVLVPSASIARPAGAETLNQRLRLLNCAERGFIVSGRHVEFSLVGPIYHGDETE
jgi:hypothetical protein